MSKKIKANVPRLVTTRIDEESRLASSRPFYGFNYVSVSSVSYFSAKLSKKVNFVARTGGEPVIVSDISVMDKMAPCFDVFMIIQYDRLLTLITPK